NRDSWLRPWVAFLTVLNGALAGRLGSFHRVKCVAQSDLVDVARRLFLANSRVDEKDDRHLDTLAGFQGLLGEAEAFDFREEWTGQGRRDIEHRASGRRPGGEVHGPVINHGPFT